MCIKRYEFQFESHWVHLQQHQDGRLWFYSEEIASLLGARKLSPIIDSDMRIEGIDFCFENYLRALIDLGNVYRTLIKSRSEQAERFEEWLASTLLPELLNRQTKPDMT
ncbi:BRO family protein [Pseudomonas sp. FEN]|uniref:BRO family protein n=1 Tax=Pseudomonas sp. FEN TaxID=2767468 RepID=UPI001748829C|nr:BRO family protein [Pseudomonas sp. FEN]